MSSGLVQSEWEVYMTGVPIQVWRKELVYLSMILFLSAGVLHICIRIFLVIKLGRKEFLTKTSLLALILVCALSSLIMFYTMRVSHIKDQFHPAICLLFNILIITLLLYLLTSNKDALEMVKRKIKRFKRSSSYSAHNEKSLKSDLFVDKKQEIMLHNYRTDNMEAEVSNIKDIPEEESKTSMTWVGIVKMVDIDQQKRTAVIVNKRSNVKDC